VRGGGIIGLFLVSAILKKIYETMKQPEIIRTYAEEARKRVEPLVETCRKVLSGNGRYVGVAAVFLLAIWYNVVVAPVDELQKDSEISYDDLEEQLVEPDLEGNHPAKTYTEAMSSLPGDWYRIGVRGRAIDTDETLRVLIVSDAGTEREVGLLTLPKGEERFEEFVFSTDDIYRDVIIRKEGETELEMWRGGRIVLPDVRVGRLDIESVAEATRLLPTISRQSEPDRAVAMAVPGAELPSGFFVAWGAFRMTGEKLPTATFLPRQKVPGGDAKYALELHDYDPETREVDGEILASFPYDEDDLMDEAKDEGSVTLEIPGSFETGEWYALLLRETSRRAKGNLELSEISNDTAERGSFLVSVRGAEPNPSAERLLSGAVVEDLGSMLRYEYRMRGTKVDFLDLADASESVVFDDDKELVAGKAEKGEYFTYEVDTIYPFEELSVSAEQYRDYEDHIALEYSFDGDAWTAIPYTQADDEPQRFAGNIPGDGVRRSFFLRVSFAGEEDEDRDFALRDLRITGTLKRL
jgi:hypothetical protein